MRRPTNASSPSARRPRRSRFGHPLACFDFERHQVLQRTSVFGRAQFDLPSPHQEVRDTGIEEIELRGESITTGRLPILTRSSSRANPSSGDTSACIRQVQARPASRFAPPPQRLRALLPVSQELGLWPKSGLRFRRRSYQDIPQPCCQISRNFAMEMRDALPDTEAGQGSGTRRCYMR
jgi:hypothetical protein